MGTAYLSAVPIVVHGNESLFCDLYGDLSAANKARSCQ
jgi:hypothetical protein